jgi:hypothetical protein
MSSREFILRQLRKVRHSAPQTFRIFESWNGPIGSETEGTLVLAVKWHDSFSVRH